MIKHIVYLMLENRSLDNVLGWLYDDAAGDRPEANIPQLAQPCYDGLKTSYFNLDKDGKKHFVTRGTGNRMDVPSFDPFEVYQHVNNQLFGSEQTPASCETVLMNGFYKDYATWWDDPKQIMQSYTPDELPVLNGLARAFAVSDRYFSSVPTQTNCNRAFAAAGNSLGLNEHGELEAWVNNRDSGVSSFGRPVGRQFNQRTMWNVLSESGKDSPDDWMIYHSEGTELENVLGAEGYNYTRDVMEQLQPSRFDGHFDSIHTFYSRAKAGTLPSFCFLEPEWGLAIAPGIKVINGNDYHPPLNLGSGETFLKTVYDALTSNPDAWSHTLFIVNFDEHGGTYDHVATPWNASVPWSNGDIPSPSQCECGFLFDRFGVRVPLILASPWVNRSTVFRSGVKTPYDHTSVIATILTMMGVQKSDWKLGARVCAAPTFDNVLCRSSPREDIPVLETNRSWQPSVVVDPAPNDIQRRMASTLLVRAAQKQGLGAPEVQQILASMEKTKTVSALSGLLMSSMNASTE